MPDLTDIVSTKAAIRARPTEYRDQPIILLTGVDIEHRNGEVWFHPNQGGAPFRVHPQIIRGQDGHLCQQQA